MGEKTTHTKFRTPFWFCVHGHKNCYKTNPLVHRPDQEIICYPDPKILLVYKNISFKWVLSVKKVYIKFSYF